MLVNWYFITAVFMVFKLCCNIVSFAFIITFGLIWQPFLLVERWSVNIPQYLSAVYKSKVYCRVSHLAQQIKAYRRIKQFGCVSIFIINRTEFQNICCNTLLASVFHFGILSLSASILVPSPASLWTPLSSEREFGVFSITVT